MRLVLTLRHVLEGILPRGGAARAQRPDDTWDGDRLTTTSLIPWGGGDPWHHFLSTPPKLPNPHIENYFSVDNPNVNVEPLSSTTQRATPSGSTPSPSTSRKTVTTWKVVRPTASHW